MDTRLQDNLNLKQQNYIAPFLWLHEEEDGLIVKEIERIYQSGIRSICLESRTHEDFAGDGWWSDMKLIFEECRKRDMKVWILDDKHFPSGYANGIFREKYREYQPWGITEVHIDVPGPVTEGAAMAECWLESPEDEFLAVIALKHIPDSKKYSEAKDITNGLSKGMVYFTLEEGMWRIVFVIKTRRGYSPRFRVFSDKLNRKATDLFIEEVYQPHYDRLKEYFGDPFLGFFSDEPGFRNNTIVTEFKTDMGVEFTHYPWSTGVRAVLEREYAEKWSVYLAGLWFEINEVSDKARYTYMNFISDEYRKNFSNPLADWCHQHGIAYIGHIIEDNNAHAKTNSGPGHYFRALDGQDMSGIDVVLHQIVPGLAECSSAGYVSYRHMNNEFFHYYLGKLGSSMAHMDVKKKGRAMCEIFGAYGWAEGTRIMKYLMDHMLVRGINYFVPHAFSPRVNDPDCPPNFYDSGNNPQFKYFKYHMDYLNRMSYMLSDGRHHSTCAILYDAESRWINSEFLALERMGKVLYDNLYDYDIIPADYLGQIDEKGYLNGEEYKLILVPYSEKIPDSVLEKLKKCNADIVIVTDKTCNWGLFRCVRLENLIRYMKKKGLSDVTSDCDNKFLRYFHYERCGAHIYMFNNEDRNNEIKTKVRLSAFSGGRYIIYDAFENTAVYRDSENGEIPIELAPYHSILVIVGDVSFEKVTKEQRLRITSIEKVEAEYRVSVARGNDREFVPYTRTGELINITSPNHIPDFSGHIRYEADIDMEKETDEGTILDLGYVGETAELFVNDIYAGTKLFAPYTFDISKMVVDGKNKIQVIVSNHNAFARRDAFSKYLLFEPSGLIGPVCIKKYRKENEMAK